VQKKQQEISQKILQLLFPHIKFLLSSLQNHLLAKYQKTTKKLILCQAEKNVRDIRCQHIKGKKDCVKTDIKRRNNSYFLAVNKFV
jgi:hypothetical protein